MQIPIVNLVVLSVLVVVSGEPQFRRYPAPYAASFRDYPFRPRYPNFRDYPEIPQPRFYFLESTSVTTITTTSTYNCRYSTAGLNACRRRRSIEEDAQFIAPSAVASVIPTHEASMDDVRDKRHLDMGEYFPYGPYESDHDFVQPSIGFSQRDGGLTPFQGSARFFIQVTTSTSTIIFTNTRSTLVTCAPLTGFANPQC